MTIKEKAAYVKGLAEGLELDNDKKETKVINAIMDWMTDISTSFGDLEEDVDDICEQMSVLDEDLCAVENEVFDEDDCDCCDCDCCGCDDEIYEVKCPVCGEKTCFDEDTLCDREINCPNCGELLEFDFECSDDGCVCGCGCGSDCDCGEDCACGCGCGPDCDCGEGCACGGNCDCDDDCNCGCHSDLGE